VFVFAFTDIRGVVSLASGAVHPLDGGAERISPIAGLLLIDHLLVILVTLVGQG
jgi:hypothetical protein